MTGREVFMLVVGGALALWGLAVWRIAWTGELPQSLRHGNGWRGRLRLALAASPPTGRLMPLLIVAVWALFLMGAFLVASGLLDGGAAAATRAAGLALLVVFVVVLVLIVSVALFNRPRAVIPPYARSRR